MEGEKNIMTEGVESVEQPMKAKDYLNAEAVNDGTKSPELCLLIGSLLSIINESSVLNPGQQKHIGSILRNQGQALIDADGDRNTKFVAYDDFLTKLAMFINTCN